jgi:serine/threonine protein kinase
MAEIKRIANFEILGRIGRGGMGAVFRARQINMDRVIALKILPPSLAKQPTFIERFMREARASAKLNHPNIVNGIDVGHHGGLYYFAMEYVEGCSLKGLIDKQERLTEQRALEVARDIALALEHAHSHGILHRDIKPDNILIDKLDNAKLCDLGLAHLATETEEEKSLTQDGRAVGTPHYISPEQARGVANLDATTDLYSLGATLYHMVTGMTLFQGATSVVVMTKHLSEKPVDPREFDVEISDGLLHILAKLLVKNRVDRYTSAGKLAKDLERVMAGREPKHADLATEKWPFKTSMPSGTTETVSTKRGIIPGAALERSSQNLRMPRRNTRSGNESSVPVGAFIGAGVVLAVVLVFLLTASDTEKPKAEAEAKPKPAAVAVAKVTPPAESHSAAAPAPPPRRDTASAPKMEPKAQVETDIVQMVPVQTDTMQALASLPKSRVAGDSYVDAPPMIEIPVMVKAPIQKTLSEARVCLTSKNYKATLKKVEQIRTDYAGSTELTQQSSEIARIEKAARDGDAGIEAPNPAAIAAANIQVPDPVKRPAPVAEVPRPAEAAKVADVANVARIEPRSEARPIDLLAKANPVVNESAPTTSGPSFGMSKGELTYSGYKNGACDFNYQPPEEYDYKLVFKLDSVPSFGTTARPTSPYGFVLQYVPLGSKSLVMYIPYGTSGSFALDNINKTRYSESSNITRREHARLKLNQEYTVIMKVRRDIISATLDGELVVAWRRDGISPTNEADIRLGDSRNLGVGAINKCNLRIISATVTEISGPELAKK